MPRRWNASSIIVLTLLAIGILYGIGQHLTSFLIPIIVLGGIFLLYKYPPNTWGTHVRVRQQQPHVKQTRTTPRQKPKSRRAPFRVIDGGKDDDDLPKYH
ncbi:hypothetical protein PghCCS26_34770 [Paenibacillus glycanilyticus]|uniref:Uncharacterized protein n=1 Tax=Paenibacillus glycanilyticus TaxID=126569 RepID=A0ABQ6NMP0_9BACL|nr:hypothetical protein [Paenibacillus glycanilyticus]GMK46348.1 hypothetical protein PghCCS26_34770 [Paenibacillus glycanilyticus]